MLIRSAALASFAAVSCALAAPTEVVMGDGKVNGEAVVPYEYVWLQCSLQDGDWVDLGPMTEETVLIGDDLLRLRQTVTQPNGTKNVSTAYLDRASLSPIRMEIDVTAPDGQSGGSIARVFGPDGNKGVVKKAGRRAEVSSAMSAAMYHGLALGLALATLDFDQAPFEMEVSMVNLDATYKAEAMFAGRDAIEHNGEKIDVVMFDVKWLHHENGDIYPPGPDASGGRYWIAQSPPKGFPYVPRYKTDTYAIEFVPDTCAGAPGARQP